MEEIFLYIPFVSVLLFSQICVLTVDSYDFKCPSQPNWKFRAKLKCNSTSTYFCLFNNVNRRYVEGCNGPDWDRKGSKRIFVGDFSRGNCKQTRFQPIKFWTNESMSDCIYVKSDCREEGQILYMDHSPKNDSRCRCDYKKKYSFIKTPRNGCYCVPTEEDCSCFIKTCPVNLTLSGDYECISSSYQEKLKCEDITRYSETIDDTVRVYTGKDHLKRIGISLRLREKGKIAATALFCLCSIYILVAVGFFIEVLFCKCTGDKPLKRYMMTNHEDNSSCKSENEPEEPIVKHPLKPAELPAEEENFLRLIHLLERVACPAVRMTFNNEIRPNQLRTVLYKNKPKMERLHRNKETIINKYSLQFFYGKPDVSSEDFDIKLMIYLLQVLANIKVGNLNPVSPDTSMETMLSRIKYVLTETSKSFDGKLPDDQFNQYWDYIGQAVLPLVSSHQVVIKDETQKRELIDRFKKLNPIDVDNDKLCSFIIMSEKYPAMILRKFISEFCTFEKITMEDVLRDAQHQLYHKRQKTKTCCSCNDKNDKFAIYMKVFTEEQWGLLYERADSRFCQCNFKVCNQLFVPKTNFTLDSCDISLVTSLILYIPTILDFYFLRYGYNRFLMDNQHTLYHYMEEKQCCKCDQHHTEKSMINKTEWNTLFKEDDRVSCQNGINNCSCQYIVHTAITCCEVDQTLLSKIAYVAGPIGVFNKIGQDAFLYFINWTDKDENLKGALKELLSMITDQTFCTDMTHRISSCKPSNLDNSLSQDIDPHGWVSKQLRHQKATTKPPLQILLINKDDLNVKSVQIPKDFLLPDKTKKITDISSEENNFLAVVHGLVKIVYPVIKKEFKTQCPDHVLNDIRVAISEQQTVKRGKKSHKDENKSPKEGMHLTQDQQKRLLSQNQEHSENLDLELMIYILKQRLNSEINKVYIHQLNVIDSIRRQIDQSSRGVLPQTDFQNILSSMRKAVSHFEKEKFEEEFTNLHHIKIF